MATVAFVALLVMAGIIATCWLLLLGIISTSLETQRQEQVTFRTLQGGAGFLVALVVSLRFAYFVLFLVLAGYKGSEEAAEDYWAARGNTAEALLGVLHDAFFPFLLFAMVVNLLHWYDYLGAMSTSVSRAKLHDRIGYDLVRFGLFDAGVAALLSIPLVTLFTTTLVMDVYDYAEPMTTVYMAVVLVASVPQMVYVLSLGIHLLRTIPRRDPKYIHSRSKLASNQGPLKLVRRILVSAGLHIVVSLSALLASIYLNFFDVDIKAIVAAFTVHHGLEVVAVYGLVNLYVTVSQCLNEERVAQTRVAAYEKLEKEAKKPRNTRLKKPRILRITSQDDTNAALVKWAVDYDVKKDVVEKEVATRVSDIPEEANSEANPEAKELALALAEEGAAATNPPSPAPPSVSSLQTPAKAARPRRRSSLEDEVVESQCRLSSSFDTSASPMSKETPDSFDNPLYKRGDSLPPGGLASMEKLTLERTNTSSEFDGRNSLQAQNPSLSEVGHERAASLSYAVAIPSDMQRAEVLRHRRAQSDELNKDRKHTPQKRPSNVMQLITRGLRTASNSISVPQRFLIGSNSAPSSPTASEDLPPTPTKAAAQAGTMAPDNDTPSFDEARRPAGAGTVVADVGIGDVENQRRLPPIISSDLRSTEATEAS